ncbi:hypothetical protein [Kribbella sp. NPDC004536]|uniref:hypothetical protein n=1 Tax=Kribbella sp. NPDC004536 TaxID=3364106 RepID=UPI0036BC346E
MLRKLSIFASAGLLVASLLVAQSSPAAATGYTPPPFGPTCEVHEFGEGVQPPLWLWFVDPLCVEYQKRDITFDNGGAVAFLFAEPSRFLLATGPCRYWQQDHWSIQVTTGATPIVTWDGNYWFDKHLRYAAAHLANFRINGASVGIGDVVIALQDYAPELATALSEYGSTYGETGMSSSLPFSLRCP